MTELLRARREGMRWNLLKALNRARPLGALDVLLLDVVRGIYPNVTANELHSELDYLAGQKLVQLDRRPNGHWHAALTSEGVDVVEYVAHCPAGIARPQKYWES